MESTATNAAFDLCELRLTGIDGRWLNLKLTRTSPFGGGPLVAAEGIPLHSIQGLNDIAASYSLANWLAAITSGALYAFRKLGLPRRHVTVLELTGALHSTDMELLANAAAQAIARLSNLNLAADWQGWTETTYGNEVPAKPVESTAQAQNILEAVSPASFDELHHHIRGPGLTIPLVKKQA